MRYHLDPTWWRHSHADGETVVAGSPTRILRFTSTAAPFLDDIEGGREPEAATRSLQRRLVDAGAIHPVADDACDDPVPLADVTVVVPAHVTSTDHVTDLVAGLPSDVDVVVIDDGSSPPIGRIPGARVLRNDVARGPAAARNRALDIVTTDFILFLDSDIVLPQGATSAEFWRALLFHMADPSVAVVAPRVRSTPGRSVLARYECAESPLDMGPSAAIVRSGARVSYVPSAALLVRTQTLRDLGGFDESFRYGEDVDLVWRANNAGHVCRYEPAVVVLHDPRPTWTALVEQRFRYGTSAAPLENRHPGSARPVRINRWSAAVFAFGLLGHPVVALGIAGSTIVSLAHRLTSLPDRWIVSTRLTARGHSYALRTILEAAVRTWWPITTVTMAISRRTRRLIGAFLVVRALQHVVHRNTADGMAAPLDPVRGCAARIVDDVSYGSGVWFGAWRRRSTQCIRPRFD